jgi:protein disulfide-isomerase-like protein
MKYNLKNPTLLFFHADWCGHCQRFMPIFDKFSKNINGGKLNIVKFDADKEKNYVKSFGIQGFPSILLYEPNTKRFIDYNGDRTITDLVKFVNENANINIIN